MFSPDYKAKLQEENYGDSRRVVEEELEMMNEYELDLNNLPKVEHNWIIRGDIASCEGAGHPYHRHFLVKRDDTDLTSGQ
jgi:hypothetical protein